MNPPSGLHTRTGKEIHAKHVLAATGAFTNDNGVLPDGKRLALHAFGEPNLLFEVSSPAATSMKSLPTIVTVDPSDSGDENLSLYLVPPIQYGDGRWYVRIGPGMQPFVSELSTPDSMVEWYRNQAVTHRQRSALDRLAGLLLPDLEPLSVRSSTCIIQKTPTRYPYIGHLDDDHTSSVAVGGNGHGARGQALSVVATECSVDVLGGFPVVEFAGHVVEAVTDECELYGVDVEVGSFGEPAS